MVDNKNVQKFGEVVPQIRESEFEGEQIQVADLVGKKFLIKQCKIGKDDRGEWADLQAELEDKEITFVTGSGPLMDSVKTISEKKLLKAGPIETTLIKVKSKSSQYSYYQFE
jgi:hypothetical protein